MMAHGSMTLQLKKTLQTAQAALQFLWQQPIASVMPNMSLYVEVTKKG